MLLPVKILKTGVAASLSLKHSTYNDSGGPPSSSARRTPSSRKGPAGWGVSMSAAAEDERPQTYPPPRPIPDGMKTYQVLHAFCWYVCTVVGGLQQSMKQCSGSDDFAAITVCHPRRTKKHSIKLRSKRDCCSSSVMCDT